MDDMLDADAMVETRSEWSPAIMASDPDYRGYRSAFAARGRTRRGFGHRCEPRLRDRLRRQAGRA